MSPSVESALNTVKTALSNTSESLVHVEAMRVLGSAEKKSNDSNTNEQIHKHLARSLEETTDPAARRAIIDSMGHFLNTDSFDLLKGISQNDNADPYERYFAAIAIGNSKRPESIQLLKNLADTNSYHNLVARGAIEGLKIIVINSKDKRTKEELENFIIEKAKLAKDSRLRRTCTSALGDIG
jgi:HEAT repeat protein